MNKGNTPEDSKSSTLALADPPVIVRTRAVMDYFVNSVQNRSDDAKSSKVMFILRKIVEDALEEASEVPPEIMELNMRQAAAILYYAATGEAAEGAPLPSDFNLPAPELLLVHAPNMLELES